MASWERFLGAMSWLQFPGASASISRMNHHHFSHDKAMIGPRSGHDRVAIGPRSDRDQFAIGPRSSRDRAAIGPRSGHDRAAIGPRSGRDQAAIGPRSGRDRAAIGPRSGRDRATIVVMIVRRSPSFLRRSRFDRTAIVEFFHDVSGSSDEASNAWTVRS